MAKKKNKEVNDVKKEIKKILKKKKRKVYFGQEVQDAVVDYNSSSSDIERNVIYGTRIHKAFDKLAENIINTFKFSYFSLVAKNYLILHNNNNYKKLKSHDKMDALDRQHKSSGFNESDYVTLTEEIVEYFDKNMNTIFKKDRDLKIGYAIIDLMKARDDIENFNKKAIYILIREMTDVETTHITSVVNTLKKHYKKLLNKYYNTGSILFNSSSSFF